MERIVSTRRLTANSLGLWAMLLLLAAAAPLNLLAEANFVYHQRDGTDVTGGAANTCGGAQAYVPVVNPSSAQSYLLRFKVEFQFFTDTLMVYYTTDGSTPSGALGVGSGTTAVVSGTYQCTFTSGANQVDVGNATIPAQPAGTVVKYIISARHSGGGNEIFANGPGTPCTGCGTITSSSALATVFQYTVGSTTDLYWDSNGATTGAGVTPTGTWGTSTFWSTVFDGTAATAAWTSGRNAVFAAGTDATGTYTVTVTGTQSASGVKAEEGSVTLSGGTLALTGSGTYDVASGLVLTVGPTVTGATGYGKTGLGRVSLTSGASTITGPVSVTGGILEITASGNIGGTGVGAGDITLDGGTFRNTAIGAGVTFLTGNRGIAVGAGGGTIDVPGTIANIQIFTSGKITGVGNTLTKSGPGIFRNTTPTSTTFTKLIVTGGLYQCAADNIFGAVPGSFLQDAITLNGGGISVNAGVTLSANRGITLGSSGGTIDGSSSPIVPGKVTGVGGLTKTGTGTLTLSAANDFAGGVAFTAGIINFNNNSAAGSGTITVGASATEFKSTAPSITLPNPIVLSSGAAPRYYSTSGNDLDQTGQISGSGGLVRDDNGAGNVTLSGPNIFSGGVAWSSRTLRLNNKLALGTGLFGIGGGSAPATALSLTAVSTLTGANAMTNAIALYQDFTFAAVSSAEFSGPATMAATRSVTVNSGVSLILSGDIANTAAGLTKAGLGTLQLGGNNLMSGAVGVTTGTLRIGNTAGSATGSGAVTVSSAATLAGSGAIAGNVTLNSGALAGFDAVSGTLGKITISGTTLTLNNNTVTITVSGAALGGGTYRLIDYTGTKSGSFNPTPTIAGLGLTLGATAVITEDTVNKRIDLVVTPCTAPVITCPGNISSNAAAGLCTSVVTWPAPSATGTPAPSIACSPASGSTFNKGTVSVTCTATNACGTNACSFNVTVVDSQAPVIALNGAAAVSLCTGASYTELGAVANDNCDAASAATVGGDTVNTAVVGTYIVRYNKTDSSANAAAEVTRTVTVNAAPTIVCPGNLTNNTAPGLCTAVVSWSTPTVTGTPAPTVTCTPASGSSFPKGATVVTCTASNECGTASCNFSVTVIDNEPPVFNCGQNETVSCMQGWGFTFPIINDNCDGLISGNGVPISTTTNFTCGYTFVATRIWQVSDSSMNTTYCTQVVTYVDFIPPTITACPGNLTVPCLSAVPAPNPSLVTATNTFDPCDMSTPLVQHISDVTNGMNPTIITRTYRAYDACSNAAQCVQTITVPADTNAPVITLNGSATTNVCTGDTYVELGATATDACEGNVTVVVSGDTVNTAVPGTYVVRFNASDSQANAASEVTRTVTVGAAPSFTACPSGTITQTNDIGTCVGTVTWTTTATGSPAPAVLCKVTGGALPVNTPVATPYAFPKGTTMVTCTATNLCGSTTCSFSVTVNDTEAPVFNCGQNETVSCMQGWGFTFPIITDNCDGLISGNGVPISTTTNFTCGYTFIATRIWQVTDSSANTTYCTQVVTYVDFIPPTITACPGNLAVECLALVPAPDISAVTATNQFDPCDTNPPVVVHFSDVTNGVNPIVITRNYRAYDACSNVATCVQTITVQDLTPPSLTACPASFSLLATGPSGAMATYTAPTATDCTPANPAVTCSPASGSTFPVGSTMVTCSAMDAAMNSTNCMFQITVTNAVGPLTLQQLIDAANPGDTVVAPSGHHAGVTINKNLTLDCTAGGVVITGASPALTVSAGIVSVNGGTFTTATADPTILVTGGSLKMRNALVEESSGFNQVAISITSGTLDLGTAGDLGGNTVKITMAGSLISNSTATAIPALGNTFKQDGANITSNFDIEDEIFHALDDATKGLVTYVANNVYVTTSSGSIQRGVDAVIAGDTVNVGPGTYDSLVTINKNLKLVSASGKAATTIQNTAGTGIATVLVTGPTTGVQIGDVGQGFTIIGTDGAPGLEEAAVYFQFNHSNAKVIGNNIVAAGDSALETESGLTINNMTITDNEFSGQTFIGPNPADFGFANQFTTPNVPRQLVIIQSGPGSGVVFSCNVVSGTAGGTNLANQPQGNTLVTIDLNNATIQYNTFSGISTRFADGLRARGTGAVISGNTFAGGTPVGVEIGATAALTAHVVNNSLAASYPAALLNNGASLDAQSNWWGSATGPTVASNPGGTGGPIVGTVDFSPWLGEATDTSLACGFQPNDANIVYAPATLTFSTQPGGTNVCSPLSTQPVVSVLDENSNVATQFQGAVTIAIGSNPGGGTLGGTLSVNAVNGVATFAGLSINQPGVGYTLTASVTGLVSTTSSAFDILNAAPVITVLGANPLTNECHVAYVDPGATATDDCTATPTLTTNNPVNANVPGTYTVTYVATDGNGRSATNTRTVVVVDTTAPVITVLGANPLTNECSVTFVDPGFTAVDSCAALLTLTTNSTVNSGTVGSYTVTYVATDPSGNSSTNTRTVVVVDTTPPVVACANVTVSLTGLSVSITPAQVYASGSDTCGTPILVAVTPDTFTCPGVYTSTLRVSDGTGNTNTCSSTVTVLDGRPTPTVVYVDDGYIGLTNCASVDFPYTGTGSHIIGYDAFATLNQAIAAAASGGTVQVAAGSYAEDVNVNKTVSVLGAGLDQTFVVGVSNGASATVVMGAAGSLLEGFTITRQGNNPAEWNNNLNTAGAAMQSTGGATIRNCRFVGNRTAIDINNSGANVIANNIITNNRSGILLRNPFTNCVITGNVINDNWTIGVLIIPGGGGEDATGAIISSNSIAGNWYAQIENRSTLGGLKNFSGNWLGSSVLSIVNTNGGEPGYAAQIPVAYGGAAVPPGGAVSVKGTGLADFDYTPWLDVGTDTGPAMGFQGDYATVHVDDDSAQVGAIGRIQEGVNLVSGSTVLVAPGSYTENVVITSHVNVLGSGSGNNPAVDSIVTAANAALPVFLVDDAGGASTANPLAIEGMRITGSTGSDGVKVRATTAPRAFYRFNNLASINNLNGAGLSFDGPQNLSDVVVIGSTLDGNNTGLKLSTSIPVFRRLAMTGGAIQNNNTAGLSVNGSGTDATDANTDYSDIVIDGTSFANNDTGFFSGGGHLSFFRFNGNVTVKNVTMTGATWSPVSFRGEGVDANPGTWQPAGTVLFQNVSISGSGLRPGIYIQDYSDVSAFTFDTVNLAGFTPPDVSGPNGFFAQALQARHTGAVKLNLGKITLPCTVAFSGFTPVSGYYAVAMSLSGGAQATCDTVILGATTTQKLEDCVFDQNDTALAAALGFPPGLPGDVAFPGLSLSACPTNIVTECTGSGSAVATWTNPTITAADCPPASVACSPISGSSFTVAGSPHLVTCTATDARGISNSCSFTVTVRDTVAPMITCSTNVHACSISGAPVPVTFTVTATDTCDSTPTITCDHNSGDSFPVGTTLVTCSAKDASTNTSMSCSFNVLVYDTSATPTVVYVDDGYAGLPDCTLVDWPYTGSGPRIIGFDAFATIGGGITKVASGGTVNVAAGSYAENIVFTKQVNLLGAKNGVDARGRVSGVPNPAVESVLVPANPGTRTLELKAGSAGSVIDGLAFFGGSRAIESTGGPLDGVQILNNHFAGFTGNALFLNDPAIDLTIARNVMDGASQISGDGTLHLDTDIFQGIQIICNWIINGNAGSGLFVDGNRNVKPSANRPPLLLQNVFANHTANVGVNMGSRSFDSGVIAMNIFTNNAFDGLQGGPKDSLIVSNLFADNLRWGLALTSFGNTGAGRGATNDTITCNTFTRNGLATSGSQTNNNGAILFSATQPFGNNESHRVNFNNISGNSTGAVYTGSETINMENNWWGAGSGPRHASNPGGTGDIVFGNTIDFMPFLPADSSFPIIACPADVALNNLPGLCSAVATFSAPVVSAPCCPGPITAACSPASGSSFPVGTNTVLCSATNDCGKVSTCSFLVIVTDAEAPLITCPATINTVANPGQCYATGVALGTTSTSDNCGVAGVSSNAPSQFPVGTNLVTWTVTDIHGNSASCTQQVVVVDTQAPAIVCPANVVANANVGQCFASPVPLGAPIATDNCAVATVVSNAPAQFPVGTNLVVWTATDIHGNSRSCTQLVFVIERVAPVIACPVDLTVQCDVPLTPANTGTATATDNCDPTPALTFLDTLAVNVSSNNLDGWAIFSSGVPLTATGELVTGPATPPAGTGSFRSSVGNNGENNVEIRSSGYSGVMLSNVTELNYRTYRTTDGAGLNKAVYLTLNIDSDGNGFGDDVISFEPEYQNGGNPLLPNQGPTQTGVWQSWNALSGGWSSQNHPNLMSPGTNVQTLAIYIAAFPNARIVNSPSGGGVRLGAGGGSGVWDNFDGNADRAVIGTNGVSTAYNFDRTPPAGCNFIVSRTWKAADGSGNSSYCTQLISVQDTTAPALTCPADISLANTPGVCGRIVSFTAVATDNCSSNVTLVWSPASGSFFPVGTNLVTGRADDGCGNTNICTFKVIINDTERPSLVSCAPAQLQLVDSTCLSALSNLTGLVTATDNCAVASITQSPLAGTLLAIGVHPVTLTVTDPSGNSTNCVALVTVREAVAPTILSCAPPQLILLTNVCTTLLPDYTGLVSATNHCGGVVITQIPAPGTVLSIGVTNIVFTVINSSSNSTTCGTTVTVRDTIAPVITCPASFVFKVGNSTTGGVVNFTVTATDECDTTPTVVCTPASGSFFPIGNTAVSCSAVDDSGNTNTCGFTITVLMAANTSYAVGVNIPDANLNGLASTKIVNTPMGILTDVNVTLNISNGWNGDLYAYLVHDSGFSVLLNRVGATGLTPLGYGDPGFNVTLDDQSANGDIHLYRATLGNPFAPLGGPLTGSWAPDARSANPAVVTDASPRTDFLNSFNGLNPNGEWTLYIADVEGGDESTLVSWGLQLCGLPPIAPSITTQPVSRTIECSSNATFTVTTSGTAPLTNQWYFGGTPIPGATNLTLTIANASLAQSGQYTFVLCNMAGCVTSAPAVLTVQDTRAPMLTCSTNRIVECATPAGSVVTFSTPAADDCDTNLTVVCTPSSGSVFPPGVTTVNCLVADVSGNSNACSFTISIVDRTAPVLCVAPPVVSSYGTLDNFVGPEASQPSSNLLLRVIGLDLRSFDTNLVDAWFVHTITNVPLFAAEATLRIKMRAVSGETTNDTITLGFAGSGGTLLPPQWSRRLGQVGTDPGLTGSPWTPGLTNEFVLNLGALPNFGGAPTDFMAAIRSYGRLDILVQDDTDVDSIVFEVKVCPCQANLLVDATPGLCGTNVTYPSPAFTDDCDTSLTILCLPPSGSFFAVGATEVACAAIDDSGNSNRCSFTITVRDTQAPTITCPAAIMVNAAGPGCASIIAYTATVSDNCGSATLVCVPPSGSSFAAGTNTVLCTAADANGNTNSCSFTVTVQPAADVSVTVAAGPNPVVVGNELLYTVTISNQGPCLATGITLSNLLSPGQMLVRVTNGTGSLGMACPAPAPLAWWRAEGNASDSAGANHGTLNGGVSFVAGEVGQAFQFDGVNDYVSVPDAPALRPASFTIEGWVKIQDPNGVHVVVSKPKGVNSADSYAIWVASGVLFAAVSDNAGSGQFLTYPELPTSSLFAFADIVNLQSLANKLKNPAPADLVSQFISNNLSAATLTLLGAYVGGPDVTLQRRLVGELNNVIESGAIYTPARFAGVTLSAETQYVLGRNPVGPDLVRLNRLLIRDAYPSEIAMNLFPQLNQRYHIAYSFDDVTKVQALYINGGLVDMTVVNKTITYDGHALLIGADDDNGTPASFFQGDVDELTLYGRALSGTEIESIHRADGGGKCPTPGAYPIGNLASGTSHTVTLVTVPTKCVTVSATATIAATSTDPSLANNTAIASSTVQDINNSQLILTIVKVSPNSELLEICWPTICGSYELQATGDLTLPITWTTVAAPVQVIGNKNCTIVQPSASMRYFRLVRP